MIPSSRVLLLLSIIFCSLEAAAAGFWSLPVVRTDWSHAPLVAADFTSDSHADLLLIGSELTILLGGPSGAFERRATVPLAEVPVGGLVGDFNGDGRVDIALLTPDGSYGPKQLITLLGRGDATFESPIRTNLDSYYASWILAADFDGDGRLDILTTDGDGVVFVRGLGNGTFGTRVTSSGPGRSIRPPTIGDVNGDGKQDLVDGVAVWLGNGDGTFREGPRHVDSDVSWTVSGISSTVLGDFNGDGILDRAMTLESYIDPSIAVAFGRGDGSFGSLQHYRDIGLLSLHDMNGDGILDLIGKSDSQESMLSIMLGNGDGTFRRARSWSPGHHLGSIAVADFNGDGRADVAAQVGHELPGIVLMAGTGDGALVAHEAYRAETHSAFVKIMTGDFDGDGAPDFAVQNDGSATRDLPMVEVYLNEGEGKFGPPIGVAQAFWTWNFVAASGDLNGDSRTDLIVQQPGDHYAASYLVVYLSEGGGSFRSLEPIALSSELFFVEAADVTADGIVDLVLGIGGYEPETRILAGRGDGTFTPWTVLPDARGVTFYDLDRDGRLDVLLDHRTYLNRGNGVFEEVPERAIQRGSLYGDFTGDGIPDSVSAGDGVITIREGKGDGTFRRWITYLIDTTELNFTPWEGGAAAADIDADGNLDVVFSDGTVLFGDGAMSFRDATTTLYDPRSWPILPFELADLDGDGRLDFVRLAGGGAVVVLNRPKAPAGASSTSLTVTRRDASTSVYGEILWPDFTLTAQSPFYPTGAVFARTGGRLLGIARPGESLRFSPDVGSHSIRLQYSGDALHAPSETQLSQTVVRRLTDLGLAVTRNDGRTDQMYGGDLVWVEALLRGTSPLASPSGWVEIKHNDRVLATLDVSDRNVPAPLVLATGANRFDVRYSGDDNLSHSVLLTTLMAADPTISATNSTVTAAPLLVPADGAAASTVHVQLRTPHGLILTLNTAVQISTTLGSISQVEYLGLGRYSATLTSRQAGSATITAVANGVELQQKQIVTFEPATPSAPGPRRRSAGSGQ